MVLHTHKRPPPLLFSFFSPKSRKIITTTPGTPPSCATEGNYGFASGGVIFSFLSALRGCEQAPGRNKDRAHMHVPLLRAPRGVVGLVGSPSHPFLLKTHRSGEEGEGGTEQSAIDW